ncbi:phage Gp37/Gp68 family protein [Herminiimonas contaminans]|uniref:Phage Gp37/Gp68 family protein n=1 Tax=Herminiimonas contaminans TaxID=1111140 RepID=A0ABS0EQ25_9BURK|nr:phage Gp37/Gp68 family protein [Herminiimonas contaminans]MBF8176952.1 phage Gp37/Gp68 family protein [Herminiimonas contaminans]
MSENTKIEWADHTFNPWEGCQKVGPGCDHCYAESRNARFGAGTAINWGPGAPRRRTSVSNWNKPVIWNKKPFFQCEGCAWRGHDANFAGGTLTEGLPSCPSCDDMRLKLARPRVFCASLADVFDNEVPQRWRQDLFDLITDTPNLDWLLLTKRIGNAKKMLNDVAMCRGALLTANDEYRPPANVWIGATIVNQEEADRDIPKLLSVPAEKRFLSMEPLLSHVDLTAAYLPCETSRDGIGMDPETGAHECCSECDYTGIGPEMGIDWVIAGGESGPGARPMHPSWIRSLRDQCVAAEVPFLFKQWGEYCGDSAFRAPARRWTMMDRNGVTLQQAGSTARMGSITHVAKVGKVAAGRLLDGREWNEVPQ